MRKRSERADIGAAVMTMMLPEFFGFEMAAESGLDFIAGEKFLDRHATRRRQRTSIVFAVDSSMSCRKLFIRLFFTV